MILVTGGSGIVGTRLLFDLLERGRKVRAMRRKKSDLNFVKRAFDFYGTGKSDNFYSEIEWVEADLLDIVSLEEAMDGIAEVYHTAALVSYSPSDATNLLKYNVEGTANVVNAALDSEVSKFCHISSVAALGKPKNGAPATENDWWHKSSGASLYGLSKHLSEKEVWRGISEGLNAVIVNPSIIFGPARPDQSSGQLMDFFRKGVGYYPKGAAGYVDVRDVSAASIQLMDKGAFGERYILNAASVSYKKMLTLASGIYGNHLPRFAVRPWMLSVAWRLAWLSALVAGAKPRVTRETARSASQKSEYDNSKLKDFLGFSFIEPQASLEYYRAFYS